MTLGGTPGFMSPEVEKLSDKTDRFMNNGSGSVLDKIKGYTNIMLFEKNPFSLDIDSAYKSDVYSFGKLIEKFVDFYHSANAISQSDYDTYKIIISKCLENDSKKRISSKQLYSELYNQLSTLSIMNNTLRSLLPF